MEYIPILIICLLTMIIIYWAFGVDIRKIKKEADREKDLPLVLLR